MVHDRLDLLDDGGERRRVVIGDGRQHLAVELDAGRLQPGDKPAVGDAVLADRGIDPLDPQPAEVPLLLPAVAIGVAQRLFEPLERDAVIGR